MLTKLPILRVKNENEKEGYLLKGDYHDLYILGKDGGLHYLNIQGMVGTEHELEFEVDYNELWGFSLFEKADFLDLMDIDAKRFEVEENPRYIKLKESIKQLFEEAEIKKKEEMKKVLKKHFEEEKYKKKVYVYGMRSRGFFVGTQSSQPKEGFIGVLSKKSKENLDKENLYHDLIMYDRKLTDKEIEDYELKFHTHLKLREDIEDVRKN